MSLEMAHKVIVPQKKNYIPQFLKQRDINSYYFFLSENMPSPLDFSCECYSLPALAGPFRRTLAIS
jgi:hypothetical protein